MKSNGLERFKTRKAAVHREKQINFFKNIKKIPKASIHKPELKVASGKRKYVRRLGKRKGGSVASFFGSLLKSVSKNVAPILRGVGNSVSKAVSSIKPSTIASAFQKTKPTSPFKYSSNTKPVFTGTDYGKNLVQTADKIYANNDYSGSKAHLTKQLFDEAARHINNPNWVGSTIGQRLNNTTVQPSKLPVLPPTPLPERFNMTGVKALGVRRRR